MLARLAQKLEERREEGDEALAFLWALERLLQ